MFQGINMLQNVSAGMVVASWITTLKASESLANRIIKDQLNDCNYFLSTVLVLHPLCPE
jgi:hypothetical protein